MRVAIILAGGRSRRFAGGNKLLETVAGSSLVRRATIAARAAPVGRIIVVVGHDRQRVSAEARGPRVTTVYARDHRAGASASLRAGLGALRPAEKIVFLFLADMPSIAPALAARLLRGLRPGILAVRPRGRHGPGHPVVMRRPRAELVAKLRGDQGLGALIASGTRSIRTNDRLPPDVDTRRDLARWR